MEHTDQIPTFESSLTEPASKINSNSDQLTNLRDIKSQKTSNNRPFTTSYEDDTNITYVDEDSADNEPKLNYHPMKNEMPATFTHRDDRFGRNAEKNRQQSKMKSEYSEEIKLLKNMLPLLAKYKILSLDQVDMNNEKHNNEQFLLSGRKLDRNEKNNDMHSDSEHVSLSGRKTKQKMMNDGKFPDLFAEKQATNIDNRKNQRRQNERSKLILSEKINTQKIPNGKSGKVLQTTAILNNQNKEHMAFPKQSETTILSENINTGKNTTVLQATLHHTKLTNKDGTLEILNKIPASDNSSITKPKVIHSKAEAIGEIFKALGSNNRIVKDANGLYLISGKHVKIIHRAHGKHVKEKNLETYKDKKIGLLSKAIGPFKTPGDLNDKVKPTDLGLKDSRASLVQDKEIQLSSKTADRKKSFTNPSEEKEKMKSSELGLIKTKSQAPFLQINSTNSDRNQQGLSNVLSGMEKKFGLDLSTYNLRDLEYKLQSNSKSKTSTKFKKTTEGYKPAGESLWKNEPTEDSVPNNSVFPPKENGSSYTNVENRNERKIQWKLNGDSYTNSTVPNEVNNKVLPLKENDNSHTNIENKNENEIQGTFNDAYINSTGPLNADGKPLMGNEYLSKDDETQDSNPVTFTSKFMDDVSNLTIFPQNESRISDYSFNKSSSNGISSTSRPSLGTPLSKNKTNKLESFSEHVHGKSHDNSSVSDKKSSDVHIEVFDEAKGDKNKGTYQTSTDVKQDSESVEVIDEGESSQPAVKITPGDLSSALQDKFGKGIDRVGSDNNWAAEKGTKLPKITEASKSSQWTEKIDGVGFYSNSESKKKAQSAESTTKATATEESKVLMSLEKEAKLPESTKVATGKNESKSATSGPTWSVNVVGNVAKPQEEILGRSNRSETRKITTERLSSNRGNTSTQGKSRNSSVQRNTESLLGRNSGNGELQNVLWVNDHHLGTSEEKMGPQGTSRNTNVKPRNKDNSLGISRGNGVPQRTSMNNQGELGTSRLTNGSSEPMIPKRVVDALLLSLTQKSQGRNSETNKINNQEKFTTKKLKGNSAHAKLPKEASENNIITEDSNHIPIDTKQKVGPSKIPYIKTTSTAENTNLDNLLEKFVGLLSRHMRPVKTEKPKIKVKSHQKHNILRAIPLLKYQEKLLWDEQRKLEHQLAMKQKVLEESELNENLGSSRTPPTNVEVNLKKKIHELSEEKNFLLKKLKMLSFQEKYKTGMGNVYNDKLMTPNQETILTEVYNDSNQKSGTAPYMGSHVTYNVVNDRGLNKEHASESELQQADEQLNQLLAEYEATIGSPNGHTTDTSDRTANDPEGHTSATSGKHVLQFSEPVTVAGPGEHSMEDKKHDVVGLGKPNRDPEINSNTQEINKVTSTNIRDFDNIPRNTADQISATKSFTAGASEDRPRISTEYPIYQHTSDYIHMHPYGTQDVPYQHTTNPTSSTPSYPTPSFINKEADYASDTVQKFADPFTKSQDDSNLNQRSMTNSKSGYNGKGSQGVQGVNNVFPGTYSYGEEHESTRSLPNWRQEDANLLKEMPEYSENANTIESETQPEHYTVLTTEQDSAAKVKLQDRNTAASDGEIKPQITNTVIGAQELRTGAEAFQQPMGSQHERTSQSSNILGLHVNAERNFWPRTEGMKQPNSLVDGTNSKLHPQTSDIVEPNNEREPRYELRNSLREKNNRFAFENSESQQPEVNQIGDIHSNVQAGRYNTLISGKKPDELYPHATSTAVSKNDDDDGEESHDLQESSQQPIGSEVDGAFEVVQGGAVPTLRRNTDNPEDGVQDKTYINGDEYHLQKKYGIAKREKRKHV
ncbi:Hypothetical predicted protein [Paramuricea clavata]|uniref:Uncharacterized protein n=1 Tax=Paramuricea clavata TaxID=317549 RepID=A0A6S7G862_PARCT|nr:Hypothetical predicted protein [Paramuricea clavata]